MSKVAVGEKWNLDVERCGWQGGGCEGVEGDIGVGFVGYGGEGARVCFVDV
jgi:hypothetical protein